MIIFRKKFNAKAQNFIDIQYKIIRDNKRNILYNAIKEGESTRILGHLMRVPASYYFLLIMRLHPYSFTTLDFRNKLSHSYL